MTARVLIGFSRCSLTRSAFERTGCEAWTCDLLPSLEPSNRHITGDVFDHLEDGWDMAVLHPMCTYLTVSAAWAFGDGPYHQKVKPETLTGQVRRDARDKAIAEFKRLEELPYPTCIENPGRSFLASMHRRPDQIVQPYEFGDDASKATGLWTKGLPPLEIDPSARCAGRFVEHKGKTVERWANQTDSGQNRVSPSVDRWLKRSATYPGIADALGAQYGAYIQQVVTL